MDKKTFRKAHLLEAENFRLMLFQGRKISSAQRVAFLGLFLYVAAVLIGEYISDVSVEWRTPILFLLLAGAVGIVYVLSRLGEYCLEYKFDDSVSGKEAGVTFLFSFAVIFGILLIYYYAFFPGGFSVDSNSQLLQAVNGNYSDWHPFIHTFLFFTVPVNLFGAEEMIVFLQILYFSLGFAYLIMTIRKYGCPRGICALCVIFVGLAPVTGNIMIYPWKDCGLAIFASVATAHGIHIILTNGNWLKKKRNLFVSSIFWSLTVLMRHNAILFVLPLILSILWIGWENRNYVFAAIGLFLAFTFLIRGPLYHAYHVEKPDQRIVETVGMPMVIMGNVVKNCPERLDSETREFLYKVSPKETWADGYRTGDFNRIKWKEETNIEVIEEAGLKNILKYTWRSFRASKEYSLQAFLRLSGMVWKLDGDMNWGMWAEADPGKTEVVINTEKQTKIAESLRNWETFVNKSILKFPMNYMGWFNLALISIALLLIKEWRDLKKSVIAVPLLCYNFGTALLLTGFDWRFFYLTIPISIPVLFLIVRAAKGLKTQED